MKFLPAIAAIAALSAMAPSRAADFGAGPHAKAPPYAAPVYNWTSAARSAAMKS